MAFVLNWKNTAFVLNWKNTIIFYINARDLTLKYFDNCTPQKILMIPLGENKYLPWRRNAIVCPGGETRLVAPAAKRKTVALAANMFELPWRRLTNCLFCHQRLQIIHSIACQCQRRQKLGLLNLRCLISKLVCEILKSVQHLFSI